MPEPCAGRESTAPESSSEPDDATLVARAKVNRDAFALLYARYLPSVFRFCQARLGSPTEAEDATSHIFAKAMTSLSSCRNEAFRGWLFTIARNVVTDVYRTRRRTSSLDLLAGVIDPVAGPEEIAIVDDERARLREMLVHLSPDQRRVVELRLAGLSGREIAAALEMSIPAVKTHQFRAMVRLRDVLEINPQGGLGTTPARRADTISEGEGS